MHTCLIPFQLSQVVSTNYSELGMASPVKECSCLDVWCDHTYTVQELYKQIIVIRIIVTPTFNRKAEAHWGGRGEHFKYLHLKLPI